MEKYKIVLTLFILSICLNLFFLGKGLFVDRFFTPTSEEQIILNEMVQKTVESEEYSNLLEKETVIAISQEKTVGAFPYNLVVHVKTDQQTYQFSCSDKQCTDVKNEAWSYSLYEEESPRLPLKNE